MGAALGVALALAALLALIAGLWWVWRSPAIGLGLIVAGMAFHGFVLMLLLRLGTSHALVRIVQAWKEVLIAVLTVIAVKVIWKQRREGVRPKLIASDWIAMAFTILVVIYVLIPDSVLHSSVNLGQRFLGFRLAALIPLMYFLGRWLTAAAEREWLTIGWLCLSAGAAVTVFGLIELLLVPTRTWLDWGVNLYTGFLGFTYHGPRGLPENFFLTLPDGRLVRRMVSTYISPLGIAYTGLLVFPLGVALVDGYRGSPKRRWLAASALTLVLVGIMLSLTRLALVATIGEGVVLFLLLRRSWLAPATALLGVATALMLFVYPLVGPAVDRNLRAVGSSESQTVVSPTPTSVSPSPTATSSPAQPSAAPVPQDTSFLGHYSALIGDLKFVRQHPFGVGIGGSIARYASVAGTGESAVLGMFGDMGLIGGMVYVAFYGFALWNGLRAFQFARPAGLSTMLPITTLVGGLALIPISLTSDLWGDLSVTFLFWWASGVSATLVARRSSAGDRNPVATSASSGAAYAGQL